MERRPSLLKMQSFDSLSFAESGGVQCCSAGGEATAQQYIHTTAAEEGVRTSRNKAKECCAARWD